MGTAVFDFYLGNVMLHSFPRCLCGEIWGNPAMEAGSALMSPPGRSRRVPGRDRVFLSRSHRARGVCPGTLSVRRLFPSHSRRARGVSCRSRRARGVSRCSRRARGVSRCSRRARGVSRCSHRARGVSRCSHKAPDTSCHNPLSCHCVRFRRSHTHFRSRNHFPSRRSSQAAAIK